MPPGGTHYSAVIVGTGPAGLSTATELIKLGVPGQQILLLEMGPPLVRRIEARTVPGDQFNTHGFGGAGLFSDGKLCVPDDNATLFPEIPTLFGTEDAVPNRHLREEQAKGLYRESFEMFRGLGVSIRETPMETDGIKILRQKFSDWGVFFEYYHVHQIAAEDLSRVVDHLKDGLDGAGVRIATDAKVVSIDTCGPLQQTVHCLHDGSKTSYTCESLVLAVGKIGTSWLDEQADHLGLHRERRPVELGVRIEAPKELLDPFTRVHRDLKLFRRSGPRSLTKTFCTCVGGTVVPCRYPELGDLVVLGGYTGCTPTANTTFALMTKVDLGDVDALNYAFSVVRTANILGGGSPVVQRLGDLRCNRASTAEDLRCNRVQTSLAEYVAADLSLALPSFVVRATLETLSEIGRVIPGIDSDDILISAPCMEFCYRRYVVNHDMETNVSGVYVIGDIAGYAKGIIAASSSGMLAARGIARRMRAEQTV